jgi:AcrR family transcriptional regulator
MHKIIEKRDLLRIAGDLFRQKGYSATSIDDIAGRCGVTKGSLYHHFSGKEELALAAIGQVHEYYRDNIFSIILESARPGAEELVRFNAAVEQFFAQHPYGCLLANLSLEMGSSYEPFKDTIVAFFDEWTDCYRKVFAVTMPAGQANARAEDAVAIVQGCVLMYRIHRQLDPLRRQHARLVEECRAGATQAH